MNRVLAVIGVLTTSVYVVMTGYFVWDRIPALATADLNVVGDFFAGIFGPLAILWLVLGYFQQGVELRQNNEALRMQAQELRNAVEQQREMVGIAGRQLAAELENIEYERHNLDMERRPNIRVSAVVPSSSNSILNASIILENIGGAAADVEVFFGKNKVNKFASFASGVRVKFNLNLKKVDGVYPFEIRAIYTPRREYRVLCKMNVQVSGVKNGIAVINFEDAEISG